jgi:hypothetical protein
VSGFEGTHLARAVELLWESGHPRIAEALREEVEALVEKAERLERVLYPRVAGAEGSHEGTEA